MLCLFSIFGLVELVKADIRGIRADIRDDAEQQHQELASVAQGLV